MDPSIHHQDIIIRATNSLTFFPPSLPPCFLMCSKSFEEPQPGEGFAEVIPADFVPVFDDDRARQLFAHWQPTE